MEKRTLSFTDGPAVPGDSDAERISGLVARIKQLEYNIEAFTKRVQHITFDCNAEDAALWMLNWEGEILNGDLHEEEDDTSEAEKLDA